MIEWRGRPVPYVAIWSAERVGPDIQETPKGLVSSGRYVTREFGMLMISAPTNRTGTPSFGETHSRRQRKCMTEVRCQVCGEHRRGQMRWVLPNAGDHPKLWEDAGWVINPPVCVPCLEVAQTFCPHLLEHDPYLVFEGRSRPVAVQGSLLRGGVIMDGAVAPLRHPITQQMVGRELIVAVEKGTT